MCITCILIPLLTGLVAALLGYLLGKKSCGGNTQDAALIAQFENFKVERDALFGKNADLSKQLSLHYNTGNAEAELRANISVLETEVDRLRAALSDCERNASNAGGDDWKGKFESLTNEYTAHKAGADNKIAALIGEIDVLKTAALPVDPDDLKIVEGIGPKIEELLNSHKIFTFKQLSNTPVETLRNILDAAGPNYRVHDPGTWSRQAQLAHEGKWDELKAWQEELQGGK